MSVNKIIINTGVTYLRTLFAALVGLFTARWVLLSLGDSSYGLYGLVGSILIFVTFLNNVLAGSISRYFAYSIGQKDQYALNMWFNAAVLIHIVIPICLIFCGGTSGFLLIKYVLNIEIGSINVALKVFYISLISSAVTMMTAPFKGLLLAKQDIAQQSIIEIFQSLAHLMLMYCLTKISSNQLITYTVFMSIETILFQLIIAIRAKIIYKDVYFYKYRWCELKPYIKELMVFSGWKSLMGFGQIFFNQGLAVLLNLFFGTRINASYSVASNVSAQSTTISNSMMMAITPEIISRKGAGRHEDMKSLALQTSKYSCILVLFIALPLFLDIDNLLILWLKEPPEYTGMLCRFILVSLVVDKIASGQESAINACGRIKQFQISIGLSYILSVIIIYFFLLIYDQPATIGWAFVICYTINSVIRLYFGQKVAEIQIKDWFFKTFFPVLTTIILSYVPSLLIMNLLPQEGMLRLLLIASFTTFLLLVISWFYILTPTIRNNIKERISLHK